MGARLVTAIETEEGRRWAESKIKALTGGDKISARFMRGDFFEFTPAFKLIVVGNHTPHLRHVDEAMRRRLHLIPFNVTIPPEERDKNLAEELKAEWPGILQWMIEVAGRGPRPAPIRHRGNKRLSPKRGYLCNMDRRTVRVETKLHRYLGKPLRIMESVGRTNGRTRNQPQGFQQ
jgi:hypothetical protein